MIKDVPLKTFPCFQGEQQTTRVLAVTFGVANKSTLFDLKNYNDNLVLICFVAVHCNFTTN